MKIIVGVIWGALTVFSTAARGDGGFDACRSMFPGGAIPVGKDAHDLDLCKTVDGGAVYAVRYDRERKTPDWAAHLLTPDQARRLQKLKRPKFFPDPMVEKTDQAVHDSYSYTAYSRGHIVPAHDMSWNAHAYKTTFSLINVVPQKQVFNAGTWLGMEYKFRDLVKSKQLSLWDISGVYGFNADIPTIGQNPHTPTVPKCFFKIIVARPGEAGLYKVMAGVFEYDDRRKQGAWTEGLTTLARIERRTGLSFFSTLRVEQNFDAGFWGVDMPDIVGDCF